ncbi:hypothetical protein ABFT51_09095 [Paenibacillus peoriae]|uniref:hypothetical protein n=1 Tax=Paenibacillus peoriae TaxID=59893 RepID=UPI0032AF3C68
MTQSIKEIAIELSIISGKMVLDDWMWKAFGYNKRPKRGAFFTKFISRSRLVRETFLIREIFIACCSSGLIALSTKVDTDMISKIIGLILDTLLNVDGVTAAFRFNSRREAENYILEGFNEYMKEDIGNFNTVLFDRAQIFTEDYINKGWLVSAARLIVDRDSPLVTINETTKELINNVIIYDI